ncbi:hypothetical protein PRN20_03315 [Devosia sp. ZB163]|uniref:hypothetical protein n=1 Tax=Devosia sp. ZB163 TaxID=3025938 RepID=UPI002361132B|nr:hypothetical protein [Devosia sp. ZB163]MDC9822753.1 hypothetical protein [Devosia sp. ZB163]
MTTAREFELPGGKLYLVEKEGMPPVALLARPAQGAGGAQEGSDCYNCWKRYFDCLFGEGTDIDDCLAIGRECDSVCRAGTGGGVIFLEASSAESVRALLKR